MSSIERLVRTPAAAFEFANILLTTDDATLGASEREAVWTHRGITLWRYRSSQRTYPVPVLLVFALINRPAIFDLRPGNSFVEHLLQEGFDVFLLDWGHPEEEDADMGLDEYVCDELHWGIRETLRASGAEDLTLLGWCIGATLSAMYCGLPRDGDRDRVRNLALLTMPVDPRDSTYARWVGDPAFDVDGVAEHYGVLPGRSVDFANKMLKPVTNFWTTYRRLWQGVLDGKSRREAYQPMAKWVADNPNFPGRAFAQWIKMMYRDGDLVSGRVRLRGRRVDLARIDQNLLIVTAAADHIAPRPTTMPIFDLVSSEDVTHIDRPGGHIGLIAGSAARNEIWPEISDWLRERSER
ncbi:MAG: alpha/beta fold hydrolase [Solirubrobacterales bacterium]|nr:alpha/beta fold hydrolase [Solirubrobacterales bacterium]